MSRFLAGGWDSPLIALVGKTLHITVTGLRYKYGRIPSDDGETRSTVSWVSVVVNYLLYISLLCFT